MTEKNSFCETCFEKMVKRPDTYPEQNQIVHWMTQLEAQQHYDLHGGTHNVRKISE
jgi:formate dehydrogenase assembly factor FdhD